MSKITTALRDIIREALIVLDARVDRKGLRVSKTRFDTVSDIRFGERCATTACGRKQSIINGR